MAIQGFFTGDVKIRDLNGVLKAVDGIVEVATDAGTVTSVGIQVGSTGADVNVANSPVTTSGNITLNLPTASATNRGLLSSADWAIFDAKQGSITLTTTGNNGSATLTSGTLNIPTYTLAGLGGISLTSLSASSPLLYNNTTGAFSIQVANGSQNGYLSSVDWTTFNSKQGAITLTTTGSSGAATLIGTTLNIPNYTSGLTGYVPYTGATTNVDLGEFELKAGQFTLDVSPTGTAAVGTTRWNNTIGSSETTLKGGSVLLKNGVDLVARVVNKVTPNTTLTKATYPAVRVSGAAGQRLAVAYAQANNDSNSADTIGLVTETIATNQEGFIMTVGQLLEINTTGSLQGETWVDGDVLYLSPTTAGALTNVKPTGATGHIVVMGYVEYAHAVHGSIYVKVMNGWELDELHNVYISSPVNNQGLFYESATSLWKNKSIATVLGYTPANAATTITINGTTYDLSANRTWNVGTVTSVGTSGPLTGGTITGSGTIGITQATTSTDGYLSSTDWNTFNGKQAAGSYITALTGEATASGPGSATVTLSTSAVTGKLLTGLNLTGGGTIAATDSILQAFGKVQNQISGMVGGVTFQGTWNASTNTPTLTSSVGTKGYYYIVDVAGSTNLNGITDWKIGDWAIFNGTTWDKVDNTDAVSSVNGFTGAVSLTTSNIAEGTNLYYLDSRARLALSFTAGSGAYDNTTGVITIPTNTSQLTNGANYITLSSLSASSPLAYNSGSGAFSIQVATGSQNGYLSSSDWTTFNSKQNAITLTTTGSSGSATLVGATLNVPTYTLSGLGGVPTTRQLTINGTAYDLSADRSWSVGTHTGSLTSGYIPKANGTTSLTDSLVYDTGTAVLIGTTTASTSKFMVYSTTADNHYQAIGSAPSFRFADTITSPTYTGIVGLATASNHFIVGSAAGDMVLANNTTSSLGNFLFGTGTTERMRITPTGNVSINNTNNTYRFDVTGTVRFTGQLRLESTITDGTYTYTLPSATGTLALTSAIPANPVGGTGTTNYLPKFTGTSTIGNSQIFDNGTNVGIGTASVSGTYEKLAVAGGISIKDNTNAKFEIGRYNTTGAQNSYIKLGANSNSLRITNNTDIADLLELTNSGNLGLGVTPSASTIQHLEFGSNAIITSANSSYLLGNAVFNSGWKYITSGVQATQYQQTNGSHAWYNAPSGTAGNAISFTQAMTLNASGNLSVGNTNDTYKLDVSGTGRFTGVVTIGNAVAGTNVELNLNGVANKATRIQFQESGTNSWLIGNGAASENGNFEIYNANGQNALTFVKATSAATFSSSVEIGQSATVRGFTGTTGAGMFMAYGSAGAGVGSIYSYNYGTSTYGGTVIDGSYVAFYNSGSEKMRITGGNVGIGTTSPAKVLDVYSSATTNTAQIVASDAGSTNRLYMGTFSNGGYITFGGTYQNGWSANGSNAIADINFSATSGASSIQFSTSASNGVGPSERMRITSGGNVGIGTTSPLQTATNRTVLTINGTSSNVLNFGVGGTLSAYIYSDANDSGFYAQGNLYLQADGAKFTAFVNNGSERMRITSGGIVCVGKTDGTFGNVGHALFQNGQVSHVTSSDAILFLNRLGSTGDVAYFYSNSTAVGSISVTGSATAYNTSSDYRLKTDYKDFSGLDLVSKIKTYDYEWKADKTRSYGVIAHELQSVINYAVTGVKDGKEMQGVDYSKIVPVLIKSIQELKAELDTLKNK